MQAIVCRELGPPQVLRLEDVDPPEMGPGQVRVAIRAAGINFPDVLMVAGGYQHKPPLPFVPGMEAAGEVIETAADVDGWRPGDKVIVRVRPGAFAEQAVATPEQLLPMPAGYSFVQGAAFIVGNVTAYHALVDRGRLRAGETALIHGAAGGVGLAAVRLAKLLGAQVIATGGSDAKLEAVKAAGADHVINVAAGGFREQVKALTGGAGADVIYDPVGGDVFDESLRCINWGGRMLVVGFADGRIPEIPANYPLLKGCAVIGLRAGEHARRDPAAGRRNIETLLRHAEAGELTPHVHDVLPLARAAEALQMIVDRQVVGKLVLSVP